MCYSAVIGQMASLLLRYGADLDLQDFNGYTALHYAVINEDKVRRRHTPREARVMVEACRSGGLFMP